MGFQAVCIQINVGELSGSNSCMESIWIELGCVEPAEK
jgi:hypothetical protein